MLNIEVHNPIENQKQAMFYYGDKGFTFGLDDLKEIINQHPKETEITLNIHCTGGSVSEGLAIYDYLRTSGKNIYTNIEGDCHSMAIVLLLSAPQENRTCNKNSTALIHKVSQFVWDNLTEKQATAITEDLKLCEAKILDIYAERTGKDKDYLQTIMNEEKTRDANFLLENNFVSHINDYNTNQKLNKKMSKKTLLQRATEFLNKRGTIKNFVFSDAEGNTLFETQEETDHLEIGMTATPDGVFALSEDTTDYKAKSVVTIENGVITNIEENNEEEQETESLRKETGVESNDLNALRVIKDLQNKVAEMENTLNEATNIISDFVPNGRKATPQTTDASNVIERLKQNRNK